MRHRKNNNDISDLNIAAEKQALLHSFEDFLISEGLECEELAGIVAGAEAIIEEEANRRAAELLSRMLEKLPPKSAAALELRRCIFDRRETLEEIAEQAGAGKTTIFRNRQIIEFALEQVKAS